MRPCARSGVPGIGPTASATLLADELGTLSRRQIAARSASPLSIATAASGAAAAASGVGAPPSAPSSIWPTVAATRANPASAFYQRLVAAEALQSGVDRLHAQELVFCNALCQHQTTWDPTMA